MVFLGHAISNAEVILLYRYVSSVSIVWLSQFRGCSSQGSSSSWVKSVQLARFKGGDLDDISLGCI